MFLEICRGAIYGDRPHARTNHDDAIYGDQG
ncbi:hypothetical protein SAMN06273570_2079 [Candidatus Pantoea floridensis]|uniref:Uncharacterized protein n=1 Tax=Candidatus Pantoea floridensis TaxID=1938870 RepID=A0A286BU87_9GAMM|nr:hypothetical protein BX596_4446 [Enterobacteriaceae bacterium JKS000233]SOD37710.1 hypothetical protein SAMN06273570_2079 [Pantoea floridensis]